MPTSAHRYVLEVTLSGEILAKDGDPANGMVMDFSEIKSLAKTHVVDRWDHAFLVYSGDAPVVEFLATLPGHKTVILDCIPTAENLAQLAFETLRIQFIAIASGISCVWIGFVFTRPPIVGRTRFGNRCAMLRAQSAFTACSK